MHIHACTSLTSYIIHVPCTRAKVMMSLTMSFTVALCRCVGLEGACKSFVLFTGPSPMLALFVKPTCNTLDAATQLTRIVPLLLCRGLHSVESGASLALLCSYQDSRCRQLEGPQPLEDKL